MNHPEFDLVEDLVAANRTLARHGVLDAYGHVSVRSQRDRSRYLISRSVAPESVTADRIIELDLDSNPVDKRETSLYLERFIHGEIYKRRADVNAVVHSHSPSVIPFGAAAIPMRPIWHMCSFIGQGVPLYEIREAGGITDLQVVNPQLGRSLAQLLSDKPAALMRGHGAVVVGSSLPLAVGRSVYLEWNAKLQAQTMLLAGPNGTINYLNDGEVKARESKDFERAWKLWREQALRK
jgi:HCOMODA/2-hydroxy-3-carboxy-muconic semialdehyde decarboxylase